MKINSNHFGKMIRTIQIKKNLSNKDIYHNICSKSHYSRIINGNTIPSLYIINQLSITLGHDLLLYFPYIEYNDPISAYNFFEKCDLYFTSFNHEKLLQIIDSSDLDHSNTNHYDKYIWYSSVARAYVNKTYHDEYINLSNYVTNNRLVDIKKSIIENDTLFKFNIYNSMASFLIELKMYNDAYLILKTSISKLDTFKNMGPKKHNIKINLLYNLSKYFNAVGNYDCSIKICNKIIRSINLLKSQKLIGCIYYQKAIAHEKLLQHDLAQPCYQYCITYYEVLGKKDSIIDTKECIQEKYNII